MIVNDAGKRTANARPIRDGFSRFATGEADGQRYSFSAAANQ